LFPNPHLLFAPFIRAGKIESPEERFLQVTRYYLSGWHIKPKGVKKPYNPILGEHFRCEYEYPDGTKGYYIAEQGESCRREREKRRGGERKGEGELR